MGPSGRSASVREKSTSPSLLVPMPLLLLELCWKEEDDGRCTTRAVSLIGKSLPGEGPPCDPAVTAAVIKACPVDYICLAASFSLLEQPVHDDGILQQCLDNEVGAVIFAPFNSGILVRSPLPCCHLLVRVLPGQTSDRL